MEDDPQGTDADVDPPNELEVAATSKRDTFLRTFGLRVAQLIAPGAAVSVVEGAIDQAIEECRETGVGPSSLGSFPRGRGATIADGRNLELVFVHDCRNHGCNQVQCILCKHNPNKRCMGNFAHKYWVGDKLLAKCDGEIQVELIDDCGNRYAGDLSSIRLEVCILDGNKYASRCREAGEQRAEILDECEVLRNQKAEPLLVAGSAAGDGTNPRVILKFPGTSHAVTLRELKVTESSESVLAGTKRPPFRLVVHAVTAAGERMSSVRPAVSEQFVVVTKRTKNLKKQEIPSLDDPISKLNHIGKETVKKLNELKASAEESQLELKIPRDLYKVTKVREFQRLAKLSEADGHLQQKLKQLLKLSKEKWDSACEHAKTSVQVDNRMRAWYTKNMTSGLLYSCVLGDVRPDCPVALINNRQSEGSDIMEVIPMEHQLPQQRQQVQTTCEHAVQCWWDEGHPGWMIFTLGNKHFETLDQIIMYSQGDGRGAEDAPDEWAQHKSDDEGAKVGNVEVIQNGSGGRDNSATSASSGPTDTRYLHDGRMPPPMGYGQGGTPVEGASTMARAQQLADGGAPGGAQPLGPPDRAAHPLSSLNPFNPPPFNPQLLDNLQPFVQQLLSGAFPANSGGLPSFQSIQNFQALTEQFQRQRAAAAAAGALPQGPEGGERTGGLDGYQQGAPPSSSHQPTLGPAAVAAPLPSKSTFNPFESMQRVPFPAGTPSAGPLGGGSESAPTSAAAAQNDGQGPNPGANRGLLPWGSADPMQANSFGGMPGGWPSGNFMGAPPMDQLGQAVMSLFNLGGNMPEFMNSLNSLNGGFGKGMNSFASLAGMMQQHAPLDQGPDPGQALGGHPGQSNMPMGRPPEPGTRAAQSADSDERDSASEGKRQRRA